MGCGASKGPPPTYIIEPVVAAEVYEVADRPRPEHTSGKSDGLDRKGLLGAVFAACDDDGNGFLDLAEFTKIFSTHRPGENDDEEMMMTEAFLEIDGTHQSDGKITKEEFVEW